MLTDTQIENVSDWLIETTKIQGVIHIGEDLIGRQLIKKTEENFKKLQQILNYSQEEVENTNHLFKHGRIEDLISTLFKKTGDSKDTFYRAISVIFGISIRKEIEQIDDLSKEEKKKTIGIIKEKILSHSEVCEIKENSNLIALKEKSSSIKLVNSVADYVREVIDNKAIGSLFWRGHSSINYALIPKLYRDSLQFVEDELYIDAMRWIPDLLQNMKTFDILAKFQHYGFGTRLLDISQNPLVALYFACQGDSKSDFCQVIEFAPSKKDILHSESDKVSILSNLSKMNSEFSALSGSVVEEFNQIVETKKLVDEIRKEKNSFEAKIDPADINKSFVVLPKLNDPRIIAQSGAFIIVGITGEKFSPDTTYKGWIDKRIIIEKGSREAISRELELMGIHAKSLFPDIEGLSKFARKFSF